jgi:hypothetical protein
MNELCANIIAKTKMEEKKQLYLVLKYQYSRLKTFENHNRYQNLKTYLEAKSFFDMLRLRGLVLLGRPSSSVPLPTEVSSESSFI